jgi:hypothetical protein
VASCLGEGIMKVVCAQGTELDQAGLKLWAIMIQL